MSKQVEGKLRGARDEKKKKRRVIATIKKKSNSKFTKVQHFQTQSGKIKKVVRPQKGENISQSGH